MSSSEVDLAFCICKQVIKPGNLQLPSPSPFMRNRNPEPAVGAMEAAQALGRVTHGTFACHPPGQAVMVQGLGHSDLSLTNSRRRLGTMVEGETGARTIGSRDERCSVWASRACGAIGFDARAIVGHCGHCGPCGREARCSACGSVELARRDRYLGTAPRRPCGVPAVWGLENRWGRRV